MARKGSRNPIFDDYQMRSLKLIRFGMCVENYRRLHNLSQREMAEICTLYGESLNIKFYQTEIANYENYKTAPTLQKFQIIMKTMNIDESVL